MQVYEHKNLFDVSMFDIPTKTITNPQVILKNQNGEEVKAVMDNQVIVYRPDTLEFMGNSRSTKYKVVDPKELYLTHAKRLTELSEIKENNFSLSNIKIIDKVYEGGRKQHREIQFPDLHKKFDDGSIVNMRSDVFNSLDMSWLYQCFAGAYRDLCANGLVFGGQRMFHVKSKHTKGLNVGATLRQVTNTIKHFEENWQLMEAMMNRQISLKGMAHILANNICAKKMKSKQLLDDTKVEPNYKLLDYFIDKIERESGSLGYTVWNLYNALTFWSSHIDDEFERIDENGNARTIKMTRAGSKPHTARTKREDKIREFMNSKDWNDLINGTYVFTTINPNIAERLPN